MRKKKKFVKNSSNIYKKKNLHYNSILMGGEKPSINVMLIKNSNFLLHSRIFRLIDFSLI